MPKLSAKGILAATFANAWNLVGLLVGSAFSILVPAIGRGALEAKDFRDISVTFFVIVTGLLIFQSFQVYIIWRFFQRIEDAQQEKNAAERQYSDLVVSGNLIDAAAARLARQRAEFNVNMFISMSNMMTSESSNFDEQNDIVDKALQRYLSKICNATAATISASKRADGLLIADDHCQANIKLLAEGRAGDPRYFAAARCRNTSIERKLAGSAREGGYLISKNAYFAEIMAENTSIADCCLENDVDEYMSRFQHAYKHKYPEPGIQALKYYKSCIIVPIVGQRYNLPDGYESQFHRLESKVDPNKNIVGFLCVDSDCVEFDNKFDLDIMRSMASMAYSAISYADLFGAQFYKTKI